MIKKALKQKKLPYLSDNSLYILWKYLNGYRLTEKELLDFDDITPAGCDKNKAASTFVLKLKNLRLELEGAAFRMGDFLGYEEMNGFRLLKESISKEPLSEKNKSFQSILDNKFNLQDLENTHWDFSKTEMIDFFEFSTNLSKNNQKKLTEFINLYIEEFIKDNLQIEKENHYRFETQKKITLDSLEWNIEKYGHNFIFNHHPKSYTLSWGNNASFNEDDEYLFIHSLIALEKLNYLQIEKIWVNDWELPSNKQTNDYKIKVIINQKYFDEKNNINIEGKDKTNFKKIEFVEDVLNFKDKKITFNEKPNQKSLLATLFKNPKKNWSYDEIYEDWGEKDFIKNGWRKLYNAGDGVNQAIAIEMGIRDFIIKDTKQIRINLIYVS